MKAISLIIVSLCFLQAASGKSSNYPGSHYNQEENSSPEKRSIKFPDVGQPDNEYSDEFDDDSYDKEEDIALKDDGYKQDFVSDDQAGDENKKDRDDSDTYKDDSFRRSEEPNFWEKFAAGVSSASHYIVDKAKVHIFDNVEKTWLDLKNWFTEAFSGFGVKIQQGANYVSERCAVIFTKADASDILHRLEQKMEERDESVTKFFDLIGQKITLWSAAKKHKGTELEDGKEDIGVEQQYSEHFGDPEFPDLFQDQEIHAELENLVITQTITQDEADLFSQSKQK